jgi:casein kinase 1
MDYARSLQFEEQPDYNYLRNLFYSVITKQGFEFDNMFDWIKAETISYSVEVLYNVK